MIRNQHGFTFTEILLAASIATVIAYASFSIFPFLRQRESVTRSGASCTAYLDTNFSRIEYMGTAPRVVNSPPTGAYLPRFTSSTPNLPVGAAPFTDVASTSMWPMNSQPIVYIAGSSSSVAEIRTSGLYTSSVLLISALYGSNSSICASGIDFHYTDLNSGTLLVPPTAEMKNNFDVNMKVVPYNLTTRAPVACGTAGYDSSTTEMTIPKGLAVTKTEAENFSDAYTATPVARVIGRNNIGYLVTLSATYDTPTTPTMTKTCSQTRLVKYTGDITKPNAPTFPLPSGYPWPFSPTAYGPSSINVKFAYSGKPNVTLMCRDKSTWGGSTGVLAGGHVKVGGVYKTGIPSVNHAWVPCEKVTACGTAPNGPPTWGGTNEAAYDYTLTWSGSQTLPYGCVLNIDAVAVDAVGNLSTITNLTYGILDY